MDNVGNKVVEGELDGFSDTGCIGRELELIIVRSNQNYCNCHTYLLSFLLVS